MNIPEQATVLVRISPEVIAKFWARTRDGTRTTIEWGEPDAEGFHNPIFTVDPNDNIVDAALATLRAEVKGLDRTIILGGRGFGQVHEPTRQAVLALIDEIDL